jgi:nucleotide-binding universal stress UspA family protein
MAHFTKLLVGVDGSEASLHALRESIHLARSEGVNRVMALAVVPPYEGDLRLVGVKDIKAVLREPCEKALEAIVEVAEAEGLPIQSACVEGKPHEELVDFAAAHGFDLIVLGTRGHSLEKVLLGSVTARVIGYSPVDVLVVPKDAAIGWQKILCATDGSAYGKLVADRAAAIAKSHGAHLSLLSANDLPLEYCAEAPEVSADLLKKARGHVEEARVRIENEGMESECFVREGEAYKAIIDLAGEQQVQLIIVGSHGKSGLKRLLMGSVAERVLSHAPCPVLVVKE